MSDTKRKLIALVSAIQEENIIEYCYTFIGLKVYGQAILPESILIDLRKLYDEYLVSQGYDFEAFGLDGTDDGTQRTEEEIKADDCRCSILRTIYNIESSAILTYIRIFAEAVAKEDCGIGANAPDERIEAIIELVKEICRMRNTAKIRFLLPIVKGYEKGGDK